MTKVVQAIEALRAKLEGYRRLSLKETPTRTVIIDVLLEALGWDVRDPEEVQLEYPTVDGKSVDYALKINGKPVLLVEAKPLDDPLNDVKGITQVVGYAANDGIVWCVLTNGVNWKVYRSVEKCPAPDKLMFEVDLAPLNSRDVPVQQLAQQMWRFSREEMAKGTLDALGEHTFTDGRVRKALGGIMRNPPRPLITMVRSAIGDEDLAPQKIRESLLRVWGASGMGAPSGSQAPSGLDVVQLAQPGGRRRATRRSSETRRARTAQPSYAEEHHISGRPQEVLAMYRELDQFCLSLKPGSIDKQVQKCTISYRCGNRPFCGLCIQQGGIKVYLWLKYGHLDRAPVFARDVTNVGHWGGGSLELTLSSLGALAEATPLIRASFEGRT